MNVKAFVFLTLLFNSIHSLCFPQPSKTLTVYQAISTPDFGYLPTYVARAKGFFTDERLDLKVIVMNSRVSMPALIANEIQFGVAGPSITGALRGAPLKAIFFIYNTSTFQFTVRPEIRGAEDLKGKSIGVSKAGDLDDRLMKTLLKKNNLSAGEVTIRPIGGSQSERYNALIGGIIEAAPVTPPLDARGKKDGLNNIYNLKDLSLPFIYSSVHTNSKTLKEKPQLVQRFVAAMAESVYFVEKNPDKAKASLSKVLKISESEILQSAYDAYAVSLVNRSMIVPANALAEAVDVARESGASVRKKPAELFDNSFAEQLQKSGFLREIWGVELR